jgi:hypothetical protein
VAAATLLLGSCVDIANKKTQIEIEDNDRHYYPLLAGQHKDISFKIKNTGENPLMITDVITSCGCLSVDGSNRNISVPPDRERILTLSYNSSKNVGYVKHFITLYGNFTDAPFKEMTFDINVVPNAMYTKDYEELYADEMREQGGLKQMVDGDENNKGYYMDEDFDKSIHDNK